MRKLTSFSIARDSGFTVMDMLTTLGILSVLALIPLSNIRELESPIDDASFQLGHYLRLVRSRAISQTLSIIVTPESSSRLTAASAENCLSEEPVAINDLTLNFPDGAYLGSTGWSVCFNQRGLSDANLSFTLTNDDGDTKDVEIALGGGVRIE